MNIDKQVRSLSEKVVLITTSLVVLTLILVWWGGESNEQSKSIESVTSLSVQKSTQTGDDVISGSALVISEKEIPTDTQNIFDDLWFKIHDTDLRGSLTARQLLDTPGFDTLSAQQMQRLVSEIMMLLRQNELDSSIFMVDFSSKSDGDVLNHLLNENVSESTVNQVKESAVVEAVTPQEAQAMENVRQLLSDPEKLGTLTAAELLKSSDVQSLPSHLRQELANEVVGMLTSGEIDSAKFLAALPSNEAVAEISDEEQRAEITHEQWQSYENIQTRLNATEFNADTMLAQILTSQEYKTLPPYLRDQLSAEAVAMIENKNSN